MNGKKILFVDDEPSIRLTLPMIFKQAGFEVTTAATVSEALEYINKEQFDVLLSDLNIGNPGDGFIVTSTMRRVQPKAVTLILTGYPDFETSLQALRAQVDDYLTKPVDIKVMITAITEKLLKPLHRKPPLQVKRVSAVLQENAEYIIEQWYETVSRDRELSRIPLSRVARIDHIPGILKELTDRVDSDRFASLEETKKAAHIHGKLRSKQGYHVPQLIAEARLLHNVVSKTLQDHLLSIDLSTLFSDLMQIGESLHEQLEESVRAFDEEPERMTA